MASSMPTEASLAIIPEMDGSAAGQSDSNAPISTSASASASAKAKLGASTSNTNILPDLSTHMRLLMRGIPHPVVVITALDSSSAAPDPTTAQNSTPTTSSSPESFFRGMTVSSFNTVTLSPRPLVSFNVRTPSATHSALAHSGLFLAHVLSASPPGVRIADAFARGANTQGEVFLTLATRYPAELQVFAGQGTQGAPLLAGAGVSKVLRCRTLPGKEVSVEDHVVLVAEILGIVEPPKSVGEGEVEGVKGEGRQMGLLYADRGYREWGPEIAVPVGGESGTVEDGGKDTQEAPFWKTMGLNVRRGDEHESPHR